MFVVCVWVDCVRIYTSHFLIKKNKHVQTTCFIPQVERQFIPIFRLVQHDYTILPTPKVFVLPEFQIVDHFGKFRFIDFCYAPKNIIASRQIAESMYLELPKRPTIQKRMEYHIIISKLECHQKRNQLMSKKTSYNKLSSYFSRVPLKTIKYSCLVQIELLETSEELLLTTTHLFLIPILRLQLAIPVCQQKVNGLSHSS